MIKPYGLSQPPTPGSGIQTLPAFCHKERFLSYKKKGGREKGGWCACRFLTTNPATCLKVPTRFPCFHLGEKQEWFRKTGAFPQASCKLLSDSKRCPKELALGLSGPAVHCECRTSKGRQVLDVPLGSANCLWCCREVSHSPPALLAEQCRVHKQPEQSPVGTHMVRGTHCAVPA